MHFKDAQNNLYWLDDADVEKWANTEWTPITDEEAGALRHTVQIDPKDSIRGQIRRLEAEQLLPRATREFMLLFMETQFTPEVLELNPGYMAVKAFDNQIKDLRAKL